MRILTTLLILVACNLMAQKPVVKISPEFKLSKKKAFQDHLYSNDGGHYMYFYEYDGMFSTSSTMILEKYDAKFNLDYSKEFKSERKGISSLDVRYFQGRFAWLFSENNKKEDYIRYSIIPIDLAGKASKPVDIAKFKYEERSDIPTVNWAVSRDSTKLLFSAISDDDRDEEKFKVFLSVLDKDLNVAWSRKVAINHTEEQVELLATHLQNEGDVYILAKVYEGRKAKESKKDKKKKSVPAYDVVLYHFTKDSETPQESILKLGDSFIRGAALSVGNSGSMKCAGFYSNTKGGSIQGVFFLELNPDGTTKTANKKEFSASDLKILGSKNTSKDKTGDEGLDASFKFSDFFVRDDESALVVAEENYSYTVTSYNGRTTTTTTYYHSNDVVMFSVNPDGTISKVIMLPKRQMGVNTNYFLSYTSLIHGNKVSFFYNEDEDNMESPVVNPKPKLMNKFKDCVAVMTTLGEDGKLVRKQLFEASDIESLFVPNNSTQISPKSLFFVSFKPRFLSKSNFHIGTVTVP